MEESRKIVYLATHHTVASNEHGCFCAFFRGQTHFARGEWVGVVLEEAEGKNDGVVAGVRYFDCEPNHGLFVRPARLTSVNSGQSCWSDVPPRQRPALTGPPQGAELADHQMHVLQELAQQVQHLMKTHATSAKLATTVSKLIDENQKYACKLAQRKERWLRERAQLQASVMSVTQERDHALEECDRLRAEVKSITKERDQALEECDRLRAGAATVCREPNELAFQRKKTAERQVGGTRKERKKFSATEDQTIMDFFECYITEKRTPPLALCREFLEDCSSTRTPKEIQDHVRHIIAKYSK